MIHLRAVFKCGYSLRHRLILLTILAALPGFAVAITDAVNLNKIQEDNARQTLVATLMHSQREYADAVDDMLADSSLLAFGSRPGKISCPTMMGTLSRLHPEYALIALLSESGHPMCISSHRDEARAWLEDMHGTIEELAGTSGQSKSALVASDRGYPIMLVAARTETNAVDSGEIAVIAMPYSPLSRLGPMRYGAKISMDLRDLHGHLVRIRRSAAAGGSFERSNAQLINLQAPGLSVRSDDRSIEATLRLLHQGLPSVLHVEVPKSIVYGGAYASLRQSSILMLSAFLLLVLVGVSVGQKMIATPTIAIMQTITRLSQGDLTARTRIADRPDEISNVARALDKMADWLEQETRRRMEVLQRIERANRLYELLASIDISVGYHSTEWSFLKNACQLATTVGGFCSAHVGEFAIETGLPRLIKSVSAQRLGEGEGRAADKVDYPDPVTLTTANSWSATFLDTASGDEVSTTLAVPLGHTPTGKRRLLTLKTRAAGKLDSSEHKLIAQVAQDTQMGVRIIQTEVALHHAQTHDADTGLANETHFKRLLDQEITLANQGVFQVGVCLIDLGLAHITQRRGITSAKAYMRKHTDEIRAYVGDDQHLTILPGPIIAVIVHRVDEGDGIKIWLDKLYRLIAESPEHSAFCGARSPLRFGVALWPNGGGTSEELLESAQIALLLEKGCGEKIGIVYFDDEVGVRALELREIERVMPDAIEHGYMRLHYQPIVSSDNENVAGFEALLRWNDPLLGSVDPGKFIPIAEANGMIIAIGAFVLREACLQAARWDKRSDAPLFISVNVSPAQLADIGFVEKVQEVIEDTSYRGDNIRIALEITENDLISDLAYGIEVLEQLKALGFDIFIDDFGTGYSSLGYLHRLPIDALKIDKLITSELATSDKARAICSGIVAIARNLKVRTIVEGIETSSQLDIVRQLDCDFAQGFLFGEANEADYYRAVP